MAKSKVAPEQASPDSSSPPRPRTVTDKVRRALYRSMQLIRRCEEQLARCHQRGLIHGACHTYVGQEAVAAGVGAHLRESDVVFSTHRGHGHALAKGLAPRELIAELFGRETGCSRGRGGSMHLFAPEIGLMGTTGIVGPNILQAVGAGYSFKLLKSDRVAVAFFGDGAVNNGAFHEGLNMASIWKLPVLFVCENNQFATEVPFEYASGIPDVGRRAADYGMTGFEVDGNDVVSIYEVAEDAIARARAGAGPTLLECKTYRTRPHAEGMGDFSYRTRDEVEQWKTRCPIKRLRDECGGADDAAWRRHFEVIDKEIEELVEAALREAERGAWPAASAATRHVYCEESAQVPPAPLADSRQATFVEATREALEHEMGRNPRVFVLGEGIGRRGGNFRTTEGLYDLFGPARLCDTPISERGFVGLGCGAAMTGARPVIDFMFIDFINDAFGELVNQIAKMQYMSSGRLRMPILLRGCIGIGHSAATHHSSSFYSIYGHVPGLRVVVPSTPYDAKGLFLRALRCYDPVLFLEHRELMAVRGPVPDEPYEIEFGRASVVREGSEATVVALALMVHRALAAADKLQSEGIAVEVIDPRTVSPLDIETILKSVAKTGRLLIVDEEYGPCSVASEIAAQVADTGFDHLDAPIKRLNGAFAPTPYSPPLEAAVAPQVEDIRRAIMDLMAE
ncbi:MAG TPA: dehydrogenase E1 component subunit alpha/beta [Pirellulales bacterium]|nr:dehydrogenase E1 component subunit alpha/beta [Pirellulales bacterium]